MAIQYLRGLLRRIWGRPAPGSPDARDDHSADESATQYPMLFESDRYRATLVEVRKAAELRKAWDEATRRPHVSVVPSRVPRPDERHCLAHELDGTEPLEDIRARNPPARPRPSDAHGTIRILKPPSQADDPYEAAYASAAAASIGFIRACDETCPPLLAARAVHGIAVAVSTARSYSAFIAAVTAAETSALLSAEVSYIPPPSCYSTLPTEYLWNG